MAVPGAPTGLAISSVTATGLTLTWVSGGGETTFNVYGSPSGSGVFSLLINVPAATLAYGLTSLSATTGYSFQVTGVNGSGEGAASSSVSTTTLAITPVSVISTLGLTLDNLTARVAEYLGVADYANNTAAIPTDAHDLDVCRRLVNDGYSRFLTERKWYFLNVDMQVTPDGINYIFDLPVDFQGEFISTWTYPITGPITQMRQTSEAHIRALRAGTNTTGFPTLFAIQPKDSVGVTTTDARWQVVFWPTPTSSSLVLTARYRRFPFALVTGTDRSIAGPIHDRSIEQAAMAAAEIRRYGQPGPQEALYQTFLGNSKQKDDDSVPSNLGDYGDRSDDGALYGRRRPRDQYRVDSYNGTSVLDVAR